MCRSFVATPSYQYANRNPTVVTRPITAAKLLCSTASLFVRLSTETNPETTRVSCCEIAGVHFDEPRIRDDVASRGRLTRPRAAEAAILGQVVVFVPASHVRQPRRKSGLFERYERDDAPAVCVGVLRDWSPTRRSPV